MNATVSSGNIACVCCAPRVLVYVRRRRVKVCPSLRAMPAQPRKRGAPTTRLLPQHVPHVVHCQEAARRDDGDVLRKACEGHPHKTQKVRSYIGLAIAQTVSQPPDSAAGQRCCIYNGIELHAAANATVVLGEQNVENPTSCRKACACLGG